MNVRIIIVCIMAMIGAWLERAAADTLILKNGNELRGVVAAESPDEVTFQATTSRLRLPKSAVADIIVDSPEVNQHLMVVISLEQRRVDRFLAAIADFRRGYENDERLMETFLQNEEEIRELMRRATDDECAQWLAAIRDISQDYEGHSPFGLYAIQAHFELSREAAALQMLEEVSAEEINEYPSRKQWIAARLREVAMQRVEQGEMKAARGAIEQMSRLEMDSAEYLDMVVLLKAGAQFRMAGEWRTALETYIKHLAPLAPEMAKNRTVYLLREATRRLRQLRDYETAIQLWEEAGGAKEEYDRRLLGQLSLEYGHRLMEDGEFEAARKALLRADLLLPGGAEMDLNRLQYKIAESNTEPDNNQAYMALAIQAMKWNLPEQAEQALSKAEQDADLAEQAVNLRMQLKQAQARQLYEEIRQKYSARQFYQAMDKIDTFRSRFPSSELNESLDQLAVLTQLEISEAQPSQAMRPQQMSAEEIQRLEAGILDQPGIITQREINKATSETEDYLTMLDKPKQNVPVWQQNYLAEISLQQAMEHYEKENFSEALGELNTILGRYADSTLTDEAQKWMERVYRDLTMYNLENDRSKIMEWDLGRMEHEGLREEVERLLDGLN